MGFHAIFIEILSLYYEDDLNHKIYRVQIQMSTPHISARMLQFIAESEASFAPSRSPSVMHVSV